MQIIASCPAAARRTRLSHLPANGRIRVDAVTNQRWGCAAFGERLDGKRRELTMCAYSEKKDLASRDTESERTHVRFDLRESRKVWVFFRKCWWAQMRPCVWLFVRAIFFHLWLEEHIGFMCVWMYIVHTANMRGGFFFYIPAHLWWGSLVYIAVWRTMRKDKKCAVCLDWRRMSFRIFFGRSSSIWFSYVFVCVCQFCAWVPFFFVCAVSCLNVLIWTCV